MALDSKNLIDQFRKDLELRGMSRATLKEYPGQVRRFLAFLDKDPRLTDKDDLKRYLNYLRQEGTHKGKSLTWVFSILASFYDYLEEEEMISSNPVISVRKRYLRSYKKVEEKSDRQCISIEDAAKLVNSIIDTRDRAIVLLLLKTGMRRHELRELDVEDVDIEKMELRLKSTPKRTNKTLFFDEETAETLRKWLRIREYRSNGSRALFLSPAGGRMGSEAIRNIVARHAECVGLHDPGSEKLEERFTPHCCRHWFTTHLRRAGMPREFIQELRGDVRREAIDIYDHIDKDELKKSYLAHIPQLGI